MNDLPAWMLKNRDTTDQLYIMPDGATTFDRDEQLAAWDRAIPKLEKLFDGRVVEFSPGVLIIRDYCSFRLPGFAVTAIVDLIDRSESGTRTLTGE